MKEQILKHLPAECPWRDTLYWYDTITSTNTVASEMGKAGAPHGTVLVAGEQTGGRGRLGRSFSSESGMGVYLSVILRPGCSGSQLMHLTCATAVAMCDAVENSAGFRPGIKWTNDLVWENKKLGGILTELFWVPGTDQVDFAVVGIGINCRQSQADFPFDLQHMAVSASMVAQKSVSPAVMAAAMIAALYRMDQNLFIKKDSIMAGYRAGCITLNQPIVAVRGDEKIYATALNVDEDGGLIIRLADGTTRTVTSGEVSIRGMYGYV